MKRRYALFVLATLLVGVMLQSRGSVKAQMQFPGPPWTCSLDNIAATLTECAPAITGTTYYLTDVLAQSTTATGGQFLIRAGTGTNCGTGTVSILPSAAGTNVRLGAPGNAASPTMLQFAAPLAVPTGNAICIIGVATNTFTGQLSGYKGGS